MQRHDVRLGHTTRVDALRRLHGGHGADAVAQGGGAFLNISLGVSFAETVERCDLTLSDFSPCDSTIELLYLREAIVAVSQESQNLTNRLILAEQAAQAQAKSDALTGLANRRRFDRYFDAEWQRLAREQQPLTLILCDIDYFKRYNDYYGHPTGDICLAQVSDVLMRCIRRPADLVARYGGEEFAVVLPNTDTEGGHNVALAIQNQLAQAAQPHCTSGVGETVTLTMGIATVVPHHDLDSQDLLQAADLALYHAKQQGRDRIYVHAHYYVSSDQPADTSRPESLRPSLLDR